MNAFEAFGLQADTNIDLSALASRYRDLQSAVHPDRFANAAVVILTLCGCSNIPASACKIRSSLSPGLMD